MMVFFNVFTFILLIVFIVWVVFFLPQKTITVKNTLRCISEIKNVFTPEGEKLFLMYSRDPRCYKIEINNVAFECHFRKKSIFSNLIVTFVHSNGKKKDCEMNFDKYKATQNNILSALKEIGVLK
jgi:hypothetical protein